MPAAYCGLVGLKPSRGRNPLGPPTFGWMREALGSIETLTGSVEVTIAEANKGIITLLGALQRTAQSFEAMAGEFRALASENREPLRDFTQNGLYELTTLLTEARGLLIGLNRVTTEVERDPAFAPVERPECIVPLRATRQPIAECRRRRL